MSSDFNKVYYNPSIYYRPGANPDGTDMTVMNAANTSNWTAVPTDAFDVQQQQSARPKRFHQQTWSTGYPDRAWCQSSGDSATDSTCVVNSGYAYPDSVYPYGRNGGGSASVKYRFGSPYYYTMQSAQWCADAAHTASNCKSGSAVNPAVNIYPAGEFCTDSELTNCAVGTDVTAAHIYYGVRWCSDSGTLLNCQRKKIGNFKYAKHLGTTTTTSVTIPAVAATGTVTVTQSTASSQVTGLTINGVAVISGAITASSSTTSTTASQIAAAINGYTSTPDYTATASGSTVTISAATTGTGPNGYAVGVTAPSTGTVRASATLTINSSSNNTSRNITNVTANAISIRSATCSGSFGYGVTASGGTITASTGTNSTNERNSVASAVASCINAATATNGGYSATASGNIVTVRAPLSLGADVNGNPLASSGSRLDHRQQFRRRPVHRRVHHHHQPVRGRGQLHRHPDRAHRHRPLQPHRHRVDHQFLSQGPAAHRLRRRDLHLPGGNDQFRQLVRLLPHAPADDEIGRRPGLHPDRRYLPRRLHHHQPAAAR